MFSTHFICATRDYSTLEKRVPAPYLRRSFTLSSAAVKASITICGLGFYDLTVNGKKITKGLLAPYISNPDELLYYDHYDIAALLTPGENVLGLTLGNGMLNCPGGQVWDFETARYRSAPKVALALEMELTDGSKMTVEADEKFCTAPSPIVYDDLRVGEFYDARHEIPGWNLPGYDAGGWSPALPAETPRGVCTLCTAEPILPQRALKPIAIRKAKIGAQPSPRPNLPVVPCEDGEDGTKGGMLYDFGVNAAGLCLLRIHGRPGQKIVLQFGEQLDENGDLDMRAMSFLPLALNHRDMYICRGEGEETYLPSFTYHGFRYCLVLGLDEGQATEDLLTYVVMNSDLREAGEFSCSDETVNKIQSAVRVADLANFYYFPTDCPHREKNGWTADAALSSEQVLSNFHAENSYREWLRNIRAEQRTDGAIPGIIPTSGWGYAWGNGPAWDSVLTTIPYMIWKYTGNTDVIRENAGMMVRYLHYIAGRRDERGLLAIGLGDWCHAGRPGGSDCKAPLIFTDTVETMDIAHKASTMFDKAGLRPEKAMADALYDELRAAARTYLVDLSTMVAYGNCQATQAMAIYYDVFDPAEKQAAFAVLLRLIHEANDLMDVGVLGARVIFHVLSDFGRTDLAYAMITDERFPSYAYWVNKQDATALFEDFLPEGAGINSRNHHFWGDVSAWFLQNLAGIHVNPHDKSPNEVEIRPCFLSSLTHAEGWHECPAGKIATAWKREGNAVLLHVETAEGLTGSITADSGWEFENGKKVRDLRSGDFKFIPSPKN